MKQRTLDGIQALVTDIEEALIEQTIEEPDKFLWVSEIFLNKDEVKRLVFHLDYWLITGKLFREEPQKPEVQPDITQAGV